MPFVIVGIGDEAASVLGNRIARRERGEQEILPANCLDPRIIGR